MKSIRAHRFFIVFLLIYLVFLTYHAINEFSLWMVFGIVLALFAHKSKNILTLVILFIHMAIEWFEWGSGQVGLFVFLVNLFHAVMDFTFLHHEIRVHLNKSSVWILTGGLFILVFIFSIASQIEVPEEIMESIHPFVLGGVIGCVVSHIYFHIKKE